MKTAFFSVIYPASERYLDDFFTSLTEQSFQNFDVVIVNDGVKDTQRLKQAYPSLSMIILDRTDNIAKLREFGINYLIASGYDAVIFGDSDDWFSPNRVECSLELLKIHPIVVNDVTLVSEDTKVMQERYFSKRIHNRETVTLDMILEKNLFGLSNTAIKLDGIETVTFNPSLIAVDWFFYTLLLLRGNTACFTNETTSYYRQYNANTAGLNKADSVLFERGLQTKLAHYENLKEYGKVFKEKFQYFKKITAQDDIRNGYIHFCQKHYQTNFDLWWWENIRSDFETDRQ